MVSQFENSGKKFSLKLILKLIYLVMIFTKSTQLGVCSNQLEKKTGQTPTGSLNNNFCIPNYFVSISKIADTNLYLL